MAKTTDKPAVPRKMGMTHGVQAFVNSGKLPSGRLYRRAMKDVALTREKLVAKYGGDKIEPDVLAMVDSAAKAMMVQELCTIYIKRAGILRKDSLDAGNLELHSVLAKSYASYANLVRLNLEAAARLADRKADKAEPDILTFVAEFDRQKAEKASQKALNLSVAGKSPEGPTSTTDKAEDTPGGENSSGQGEDDETRR
jgi:hypothetical protein